MRERTSSDVPQAVVERWLEEAMTRQLASTITPRRGALELVTAVRAAGLPLALVSSSIRAHMTAVLTALPTLRFDVTVAGDEVTQLKPNPEPYLTACARLGVDPRRCVVLEDSPPGVAAGTAAGCQVIAVPSAAPIAAAPGRLIVESLDEVDLDVLRSRLA